jgi:hypothetical protein
MAPPCPDTMIRAALSSKLLRSVQVNSIVDNIAKIAKHVPEQCVCHGLKERPSIHNTSGEELRFIILAQIRTCQREYVGTARVSSSKQKADLKRQIDPLRAKFPDHFVVSDIGSGVDFGRKGLVSLLDRRLADTI